MDSHALIRQLQGLVVQLTERFRWGSGSPEGVLDGPRGAIYADEATGAVYRKTTASGTLTGWTAV